MSKAQFESHALNLGQLLGNLQTIEMGARMAIVKHDQWAAKQVEAQLPQLKAGDSVELNAFTNDDDLSQTLQKYNKRAPLHWKIDLGPIVALRDALAHGRIFGHGPIQPLRLLKFSRKSTDGKVFVEFAVDMNDAWFRENNQVLSGAIEKTRKALDYESRDFK